MRLKRVLIPIILLLVSWSCSKQELQINSGNTAPNERPITLELKKNYINRAYISLLGRKSLPSEEDHHLNRMGESADLNSRRSVISSILSKTDFVYNSFNVQSGDLLGGVDTSLVFDNLRDLYDLLPGSSGPTRDYYLREIARLESLTAVFEGMLKDSLGLKHLHQRMVNTEYYDDINMGTENFVVSCFQNFLFRYPSNIELENSKDMINGSQSILFLQAGSSKAEFIDIFFNSQEYFEGQVRYYYQRYLFREPSTYESQRDASQYASDEDYKAFLISIFSSDEYFFN